MVMVTHKKTKTLGGGWTACGLWWSGTKHVHGAVYGSTSELPATWRWDKTACMNCLRTRKGQKR